jgi:hypothetical protein
MEKDSSIMILEKNLRCYYANFLLSHTQNKSEKMYYKHMMRDLMFNIDYLKNFEPNENFIVSNNIKNI